MTSRVRGLCLFAFTIKFNSSVTMSIHYHVPETLLAIVLCIRLLSATNSPLNTVFIFIDFIYIVALHYARAQAQFRSRLRRNR